MNRPRTSRPLPGPGSPPASRRRALAAARWTDAHLPATRWANAKNRALVSGRPGAFSPRRSDGRARADRALKITLLPGRSRRLPPLRHTRKCFARTCPAHRTGTGNPRPCAERARKTLPKPERHGKGLVRPNGHERRFMRPNGRRRRFVRPNGQGRRFMRPNEHGRRLVRPSGRGRRLVRLSRHGKRFVGGPAREACVVGGWAWGSPRPLAHGAGGSWVTGRSGVSRGCSGG